MTTRSSANAPIVRPLSPAVSDNGSDYSLNLDALPHNHNDSTFDLSTIQRDLIDVVRTDDIDGPTDFTQNLEYWMRLKLPNVVEPTALQGQEKADLEQYVSSDEAISLSVDEPQTPRGAQSVKVEHEMQDIKGTIERQSTNAIAAARHENDQQELDDDEDVASQASPPSRPRSRLQPFVEDYDGSPSQLHAWRSISVSTRIRQLQDDVRQAKTRAQQDIASLKQEHDLSLLQAKQASTESITNLSQALADMKIRLQTERDETKKQLSEKEALASRAIQLHDELLSSSRSIQQLREALNKAEQTINGDRPVPAADLLAELSPSEQRTSTQARKITELQKFVADRENALHLANQRAEEAESILEETSQAHREEMRNEQEIHDMQTAAIEEQAESLKIEFNKAHLELATIKGSLGETRVALRESQEKQSHQELRCQELQEELGSLRASHTAAIESHQAFASTVKSGREQHTQELSQLKASYSQEQLNLQDQAESAVLKMRKLLEKERHETTRLKMELAQGSRSPQDGKGLEIEDLRNEVRIMNDHSEDVERERDELRVEVQKMDMAMHKVLAETRKIKHELEITKNDMASMQKEQIIINDIVAKKVHQAVQVKQEQWKRHMQATRAEMDARSRLLMLEWGQAEFGSHKPQPYAFKYL